MKNFIPFKRKSSATAGNTTNPATKNTKSKTKKSNVYNLIIVDESGSMYELRRATLSGINETISTIRSAQKDYADTQNHFLTLVTFDSGTKRKDVRTLLNRVPIGEVHDFTNYNPGGCTPLYDAMGMSLTELANYVEKDRTASVLVTVLTDGLENASEEWDAKRLRQLIDKLKAKGWSFAYMGSDHNVKEVTEMLSIDNVMEFCHDEDGASATWERDRGAKRRFYAGINYSMHCLNTKSAYSEADLLKDRMELARCYYSERVTPRRVDTLENNEIFVFGSNSHGAHTHGAAAAALRKFGAVLGQAEGPQGKSYAIPTTASHAEINDAVYRFTRYATQNPDKKFLVTAIGCGAAGHTPSEIAPMFRECVKLENVSLPEEFWEELGLNVNY